MALQDVSLLAVVAGAVVNMILGALWYSPLLFAKRWMAALGRNSEEMMAQGGMGAAYGVTFVAALISVFVLGLVVTWSGARTVVDGMLVGLLTAVGFLATTNLGTVVFEGRSREIYLINIGYNLVSMMLVGALLAVLR